MMSLHFERSFSLYPTEEPRSRTRSFYFSIRRLRLVVVSFFPSSSSSSSSFSLSLSLFLSLTKESIVGLFHETDLFERRRKFVCLPSNGASEGRTRARESERARERERRVSIFFSLLLSAYVLYVLTYVRTVRTYMYKPHREEFWYEGKGVV